MPVGEPGQRCGPNLSQPGNLTALQLAGRSCYSIPPPVSERNTVCRITPWVTSVVDGWHLLLELVSIFIWGVILWV